MIRRSIVYENKIDFVHRCQRCRRHSVITDSSIGETLCSFCGFVISEKLGNESYEYPFYFDDHYRKHTGEPFSISKGDFGLSTVIDPYNKDARGKPISRNIRETIERIRKQDRRSNSNRKIETNYKIAFDFLQRLCDKLGVSDSVKEDAAHIYRKAVEKKITQGRSISSVMTASVYAACRNMNTLRSLHEVSEASNIKRKKISQSYRAIVKGLDLTIPVVDQIHCISKIANNLGLSEKAKRYAIEILHIAQTNEILAGRDPAGMAAAAIYYACTKKNREFTQKEIAHASGVTEVTVRNRCKEIRVKLQI